MALLEADVNFRVVKAFLKSVKSRAIGEEVQGSLTPGQQFIKIVNDELTNMMGASNESLAKSENGPIVVMVLEKNGAVLDNRRLMGATDPQNAEDGTIRKEFGLSIDKNSVHGSDSIDNAKVEISFFFAN